MSTELYKNLKKADEAFAADDSMDNLKALEVVEKAWFAALIKARAEWDALPEGNKKYSAEINAYETMEEQAVPAGDQLFWLEIAIRSYEFAED